MLAVDTNVIVRLLVRDDLKQFRRAQSLVDSQPVFVAVTVILETEWVLRGIYGFGAEEVADALRGFAGLPNVTVENGQGVANALELAKAGFDFADALHLQNSLSCEGFASFDRQLVKAAQRAGYAAVREP